MSYGFGFGFPRLASLAAAGSPFATLGPTLDLNFVGTGSSSGVPGDNDSLNLDFIGNTYQVGTQYSVWTSTGLQPGNFQDIVTYSRSTTNATYYNSSGYLTTTGILNYLTYSNTPENAAWNKQDSFVQTNLFTYSEDFTTAWNPTRLTTANTSATTDPLGGLTADKINPNGNANNDSYNLQYFNSISGTVYTTSVYFKDAGLGWAVIFFGSATNAVAFFNLATGVAGSVSGTATGKSSSITSVGNGWYRCTLTCTANITGSVPVGFAPAEADNDIIFAAGTTNGIYIWGAQLVQGAVPGNYQATTTAALPVLYADWTGALTARKICQNAVAAAPHGLRQNPSGLTGSTTYTLSFYAKAGESTKANAWQFPGTTVFTTTAAAVYDLVAGTATGDGSPTIQSVGNGWYRCTKTITTVASPVTGTIHIGPTDAAGNQTYNGDGTSGVYITDMQIEVGTSVGPYYETTQYVYNAPRFDYDPVTLQPRGLLMEDQRTNLLTNSGDLTSYSITPATGLTSTLNATLAPDGTVSARSVVNTTTTEQHRLFQVVTLSLSTVYTYSVYLKNDTAGWCQLSFFLGSTQNGFANFNLASGTVGTTGSATAVMQAVGNGWYRCSITVTTESSGSPGNIQLYVLEADSATVNPSTTGTVKGIFVWGAQLEANYYASSYISTVASQVTRAGDVASINTLSPWYNATAWTGVVQYNHIAAGSNGRKIFEFTSGAADYISIYGVSTTSDGTYMTSGGVPGVINTGIINPRPLVPTKIAVAFRTNDYQGAYSGTLSSSDTSFAMPSVIIRMNIGSDTAGGTQTNGYIQRITYYPRRLSNAELQSITT